MSSNSDNTAKSRAYVKDGQQYMFNESKKDDQDSDDGLYVRDGFNHSSINRSGSEATGTGRSAAKSSNPWISEEALKFYYKHKSDTPKTAAENQVKSFLPSWAMGGTSASPETNAGTETTKDGQSNVTGK
ncbi:hypothetical protein V866_004608 [Kwoniella sp. B9012]|uniref:Uncharacterized protein n=1 Tax=Kwoniella europaea PYCC6329 TaxID=1423913 RepID=A0AAX4KJ35_9TREE